MQTHNNRNNDIFIYHRKGNVGKENYQDHSQTYKYDGKERPTVLAGALTPMANVSVENRTYIKNTSKYQISDNRLNDKYTPQLHDKNTQQKLQQ